MTDFLGHHAGVTGNDRESLREQRPVQRGRAVVVLGLTLFLAAVLALLWLANYEQAAGWRVLVTALVIAAGLTVGLLVGRRLRRR